ncbi:MAG TPA: GWxTD domain-containing protein, partial [Candidatus Eisenbacteria bacterium]
VAGVFLVTGSSNVENPAALARARALRKESGRDVRNDSLKYELALAEAEVGTIETRLRALTLFAEIRPAYEHETRFHRDRARVYESCSQPSSARECLEDLLKIDPTDVNARVDASRLLLNELLYHYDLRLTWHMLDLLDPALAQAPDDRRVLFYHSLALELASGLPEQTSPELSRRGLADAERLMGLDSTDVDACFLAAIHAMDLGQPDRAARRFEDALAIAPEDVRAAFLTSRWTAPVAAVAALKSRDEAGRASYDRAYWRHHDPSPFSSINENQLEIWKRLALADFLFTRPGSDIHGWDTEPGLAFVRYGAPLIHGFDPGEVVASGPGIDKTLPRYGWSSVATDHASINLIPPSWSWEHRFKGLEFDLRFVDRNLRGDFRADAGTTKVLEVLREAQPVVFHEAPPGPLRYLAVTSAGVLDERESVVENVYLGVPLWRPLGDGKWLGDVTMELIVRDTTRVIVRQARHKATPEDVVAILGQDVSGFLFNQPWRLPPGAYTVTGYVEDAGKKLHGIYTGPLTVRDYLRPKGPVISDLDLTLRPATSDSRVAVTRLGSRYIPNPLRVATDDRQLDIFYEIYGLKEKSGTAFIETRYTILPRAWVEGFDRLVRAGDEQAGQMLETAESDADAEGSELSRSNYLQVTFPPAGLNLVNGRGAKGSRVPVPDLEPGEYDLVMTVRDIHAGLSATASTWFQILSPEEREDLVAMGREAASRRP